ncbi:MAG TPA: type II secretion system F family protein [Vicinamibacterales bacterium]|nr:type II secretion system F family protein [Vicinamibacterales bacterium]
MTLLLPLLGFVFVTLLVTAGAMVLAPANAGRIEERLAEIGGIETVDSGRYERMILDSLKRIGQVAPKSPSEMGKLQQRLVAAGYRSNEALVTFFGIRVGLALAIFALLALPLVVRPNVILALAGAGLGYMLPNIVLGRLAKKRQHRIRLSLPDALDLLVVSVEAGLGLDQALVRVGDELSVTHPDLSDELRLINLELRAGKPRSEALHNLGARTGVDDLVSLVAMLVQTDKFGTSVAQSLRVHSQSLRTKRRQRAEEAAAKTGVKMVFPLVFCIFPALYVVTLGPAVIKFIEVLAPMGQQ